LFVNYYFLDIPNTQAVVVSPCGLLAIFIVVTLAYPRPLQKGHFLPGRRLLNSINKTRQDDFGWYAPIAMILAPLPTKNRVSPAAAAAVGGDYYYGSSRTGYLHPFARNYHPLDYYGMIRTHPISAIKSIKLSYSIFS
jgi:hypothetical protein